MGDVYLVPNWFFDINILLELLFAFITAFVAWYSFKIYNLTNQKESRLFGTGFLLIALSYLSKAGVNLVTLREVKGGFHILSLDNINFLTATSTYAFVILFTAGLVTLAYMTFRVNSRRVYTLLLATNIAVLLLSTEKITSFNILSSILVLYIIAHYALTYYQYRNPKTLVVFFAFFCLFLSSMPFIFAPNYYHNYVISHFVELLAYVLILASLWLAVKRK